MIVVNFLWLGIGLVVGGVVGWKWRSPAAPKQSLSNSASLAALAAPTATPPIHSVTVESADWPAQIQDLQTQLQQMELAYTVAAQQSQFKGGFLTRISHELRSPLNGVIGMHQLILSDLCDSPEEERDFVEQAYNSAMKMVKVIDEVIDAAKLEHGTSHPKLQPVSLAQLLQSVTTLTHLQAQNHSIRLQIPTLVDTAACLWVDPVRVQQVFVSLIDTAIAHLQEGDILLTVQQPTSNPSTFSIWIDQPLSVALWDDSTWMPPTEMAESVEALHKAAIAQLSNKPFPSAGFAFRVAQKLVQSMNGQLDLLPNPDNPEESRLQITLPRYLP